MQRDLPLHRFPASRGTQTDAQGFYFMPTAIGDDYFDGTSPMSRVRRHFKIARELGVKYLRCSFTWNAIEPRPGRYRWRFWDQLVTMAHQYNIGLIPYVAYTPQWAARPGDVFWKQPPRDLKMFADFMGVIARRYRGKVASWELWNEPDNREYWTGTPDEFARMIIPAAAAVRQADPAAVLVLGGMTRGAGGFFRTLLDGYHIDRYVDVVAMHAYPETWQPESAETVFGDWLPRMDREVVNDRSGDDFWVNEMGYADYRFTASQASVYGVPVHYAYEHTAAYEATYLFKEETLALASGEVSLTGWYRIDDFPRSEKRLGPDLVNYHLGLVGVDGKPKPAFYALRWFNQLFDEPTRTVNAQAHIRAPEHSQAVVELIKEKDGRLVIVGWLRTPVGSEDPDHTGLASDRRREVLDVGLPCRQASDLHVYDEAGHPLHAQERLGRTEIRGLALTGDRVVIATLACR